MKEIHSELISVTTRSNFSYIASVCNRCRIIGMLKEFFNEYFCSNKCQKEYNIQRFSTKKRERGKR